MRLSKPDSQQLSNEFMSSQDNQLIKTACKVISKVTYSLIDHENCPEKVHKPKC